MNNIKILEMINNEQIVSLKTLIQEEIYKESLKGNRDAKRRYSAMKRYFKYADKNNVAHSMPCRNVELSCGTYNCFVDGYSLVCTTEDIGEIVDFDNSENSYLKIQSMISHPSEYKLTDLNKILAEAKSKGYKYKKSEIGQDESFQYGFKYIDGYFKIGILDQAFSIINDGNEAEVYYNGARDLLFIKTSIGICGILPFIPEVNLEVNVEKTIIKLEPEKTS